MNAPLPGVRADPPGSHYDVVIVGAGIQGLALAYELALTGIGQVAVLDRSWPGSGASGRNGELIRSAFSSGEWSGLFALSMRRWQELSAELEFNVMFRRAGYLILASSEDQLAARHGDMATHRAHGITTELLDDMQVRALIPALEPATVRGGVLEPDAGFAHHDAVIWAYLRGAVRRGVAVFSGPKVHGVMTDRGRVTGVDTSHGPIFAPVVVNCAGGDAATIDALAGVDVPLRRNRLQMLVTESVKPFLSPGLSVQAILGYCHQTSRGEFVGGTELPGIDDTASVHGTYALLRDMATKFVGLFPALAGVRLLRHWAGTITQTADLAPVLDQAPNLPGYYVSSGWVYGFMGAPGAARLLADYIVSDTKHRLLAPFSIDRLHTGRLIVEESLVVATEASP